MYKILLVFILATVALFAQNPIAFSALGDVIYNNVNNIEKLKEVDEYSVYDTKIDKYVTDVTALKAKGFELDNSKSRVARIEYLDKLRDLAKTNDFFTRSLESSYEAALKKDDSQTFSQIINNGLLNSDEHKNEIMDYYFSHSGDMNTTGVIQSFLDADAVLQAKKELQKNKFKSRKELEKEKIKRIRENDKLEQEKLEKKLQNEVKKKKIEIREEQKKELSKTI